MNRSVKSIRLAAVGLALAALLTGGCATFDNFYNHVVTNTSPQQVSPDEFMQRQSTADNSETLNGDKSMPVTPARPAAPVNQPTRIDPAVASAVEGAQTQPTTEPSDSAPATLPTEASASSGQFMSLGGVVAEVNGTPIYINKVLQLIWPTLRNDARTMDAEHFQLAAEDEISRQIEGLEADELLYAAALRSLADDDQKLVTDLTTAYRQRLVSQAGGSLQVARQKSAANGEDFDQVIRDQHRRYMIELYQQRKFSPRWWSRARMTCAFSTARMWTASSRITPRPCLICSRLIRRSGRRFGRWPTANWLSTRPRRPTTAPPPGPISPRSSPNTTTIRS
jgi:hypothetical protein